MMNKEKTLFIFEGAKTEDKLVDNWNVISWETGMP